MRISHKHKNCKKRPGWCGSVDWAPACKSKGCWFDSQSGHMLGLQAGSPVGACKRWPHRDVSFSFSLPFCLSVKKIKSLKKLQKQWGNIGYVWHFRQTRKERGDGILDFRSENEWCTSSQGIAEHIGKFSLGDSETMGHRTVLTGSLPEALLFTILNSN